VFESERDLRTDGKNSGVLSSKTWSPNCLFLVTLRRHKRKYFQNETRYRQTEKRYINYVMTLHISKIRG